MEAEAVEAGLLLAEVVEERPRVVTVIIEVSRFPTNKG